MLQEGREGVKPSVDPTLAVLARRAYESQGDEEIAIRKYLPLLHSVVNRMQVSFPSCVEVDDMISAGLIGLIQAYRRYDATLGIPFVNYAASRIRGAVLDELRHSDWMSRASRTKFKMVSDVIWNFEREHGRPGTEEEIAEELGMTKNSYQDLLDEIKPVTCIELDASPQSGETETMHEIIPDERAMRADQVTDKKELQKLLVERLQKMPSMARKVLAMYYFEDMRLAEIAKVCGVTESRICQIHTHAVLVLRTFLQNITTS